tara:strand:- start:1825 stop:1983 length:159 start_codon:yes stop_codon:yes gene_type:complete
MEKILEIMVEAIADLNMIRETAITHTVYVTGCEVEEAEKAYEEVFETLTYGM